ncbi:hypothetical protein HPB47_018462, partial [Ixodes persulcatus]
MFVVASRRQRRVRSSALEALCVSETPSSRQRSKSCAFATEACTLPSPVLTNVCDSSGACSHILATLQLIILLKIKGYKATPPKLSCTELPQQWPMGVQDVDWRSPREGGVPTPMPVRLFDACAKKQEEQRQLELLHELGRTLQRPGDQAFGAVLLAAPGPLTDTKLGPAPAGSQLSYQQAMLPSGYKTWTSANISGGIGLATSGIEVSLESARELELNSRQQGRSAHWLDARRNRLTASSFGRGSKREQWTETGLRNLIEPKDITH